MVENWKKLKGILCCPASLATGLGEKSLDFDGESFFCGLNRYPINEFGIPNFRLPFDQDVFTSYDDILENFVSYKIETETALENSKLSKENITGKVVLLTGVGAGTDIDWILSLNPKMLVCLDYSNFINEVYKKYHQIGNICFLIGDICDLPFYSETFDLILSQGVIHHTRSPEIAFSCKVRTLRSEGKLSISNLYSKNDHNQFVSMFRHKYKLHLKSREKAKKFIRWNSKLYYWIAKLGLARIHRRFHFPGILHYASIERHSEEYFYANAADFYLVFYRHLTSPEEVQFWCSRLHVSYERSLKGYLITKT